jgi:hypothetical protein
MDMIGWYVISTSLRTPKRLLIQHAGPSNATYTADSPMSRATIHGQAGLHFSSLMPALYPGTCFRETRVASLCFIISKKKG